MTGKEQLQQEGEGSRPPPLKKRGRSSKADVASRAAQVATSAQNVPLQEDQEEERGSQPPQTEKEGEGPSGQVELKRKRGRPSKAELAQRAAAATSPETGQTPVDSEAGENGAATQQNDGPSATPVVPLNAGSKKRGRPSKAELEERRSSAAAAGATQIGAREAESSSRDSSATPAPATQNGKKRGRPSKAELERRSAATESVEQHSLAGAQESIALSDGQTPAKKRARLPQAAEQRMPVGQTTATSKDSLPVGEAQREDGNEMLDEQPRRARRSATRARQSLSALAELSQVALDGADAGSHVSSRRDAHGDGSEDELGDAAGERADASFSEGEEDDEAIAVVAKRSSDGRRKQTQRQEPQQRQNRGKSSAKEWRLGDKPGSLRAARALTWIPPMPIDILVDQIQWPHQGLATLTFNQGSNLDQRRSLLALMAIEATHMPSSDFIVDRDGYPGRQWSASANQRTPPHAIAAPSFTTMKRSDQTIYSGSVDSPASTHSSDSGYHELYPEAGDKISLQIGPKKKQQTVSLRRHESLHVDEVWKDDEKEGHLFNVGGHVYSLDWAPLPYHLQDGKEYLAVSAALTPYARSILGDKVTEATPGEIQIWSISPRLKNGKGRATLEMVLCSQKGRASAIQWCPGGCDAETGGRRLGLLAAAMQDGSVEVLPVPWPEDVKVPRGQMRHLAVQPTLIFDLRGAVPLCLDWLGADKLAVGYHDGTLAIWAPNLRRPEQIARNSFPPAPIYLHKVARAAISALTWNRDQNLGPELPLQLFYSSLDGTIGNLDLSLPYLPTTLYITRDPLYAVTYSSFLALPLYEQSGEMTVRAIDYRTSSEKIVTTSLYPHWGRVRSIATSNFHPFCASAAADGTVRITNVARSFGLKSSEASVVTLFRLDIGASRLSAATSSSSSATNGGDGRNENKAKLRMLENIAPTDASIHNKSVEKGAVPTQAAWHPSIAWTTVKWNRNLMRAPLLASGSAVGLVRVDWCLA